MARARVSVRTGDARVVGLNGDAKITADGRTFIPRAYPDHAAGLTNTLRHEQGLPASTLARYRASHPQEQGAGDRRPGGGPNPSLHRKARPLDLGKPVRSCSGQPGREQSARVGSCGFRAPSSRGCDTGARGPERADAADGRGDAPLCASGRNSWMHTDWTGLESESLSQRGIPPERGAIDGARLRSQARRTPGLPITNGDAVK